MPVPQFQGVSDDATLAEVKDFIYGHIRRLNDFLAHLDTLNVDELNAEVINAGILNAALVTIKAALDGLAYIQLSADGMVINDGTKDTFTADINGFITLVGALFKSASGYPRVEINSADNIFGAYASSDKFIKIISEYLTNIPAYLFKDGTNEAYMYLSTAVMLLGTAFGNNTDINVSSGRDLFLNANSGYVRLLNWAKLYNATTGTTLQQALNAKQDVISGYSGSFSTGTQTVVVNNGIITSVF